MKYKPLSKREESIAEKIVDAAYTVHKILGPGLLEKVYEVCFCHELSKRGLQYKRQVDITIIEMSNYETRAYRNHLSKIF